MSDFVSLMTRQAARALVAATVVVLMSPLAWAQPPDLTAGGVPGDTRDFNLGATGARGWAYHVSKDTSESRQILVTAVDAGSPAAGQLAVDDVILGADGLGVDPANFSADARKSLAYAIADAEAQSPAILKLLVWRAGVTSIVELTLQTMGAYSATAPYACPKSALILEQGIDHVMGSETAGRYSFGSLSLLAANDPADPDNAARLARAQAEVQALIPDAATITQLMSDERDASSVWQRGHTLIVLAEYYLQTNDASVLPAIEAYAVNIARNHSMFGTAGHIYAEKNKDGSDNGPMGGGYGAVNSSGLPAFLGLLLARECGLTHPGFDAATQGRVEAGITRASRFFGYYAGRGAIPYGEHTPSWNSHESNGKSGLAALCFALESGRAYEEQFNAQLAVAATSEREVGHTGSWFNYLWSPLGAATGGEEAAASHFSRISWMLDLSRSWDGGFVYDSLYGEGPQGGAEYNDFRMSTAALLVYALPLRQLHITGRGDDPLRDLTTTDIADAVFADTYNASTRGTNDLLSDLGSWSPKVHMKAAEQLATRTVDAAMLAQITAMATDTGGSARLGATYALGKINDSSTADARAATLAGLLTDADNHVRYIAAEAMRYLPQSAKMTQLDAVLSACASTATPFLPFDEEDPMHMAHGRLCMLLFYSGNAYGPKGMIWGSGVNGVDRGLLYPAFRAVAANPIGQARSTIEKTYDYLTAADMNALADSIVDSIYYRPPADKMFSAGSRTGGVKALQRFNIAEGVPLCKEYIIDDGRSSNINTALGVLQNYAGSSTLVQPDPEIIAFCQGLLTGGNAAAAQAVLDAIDADLTPVAPVPFKSIQSVTTDAASVTLPANQTVLHCAASDHAQGELVYTWRKVHGAGNVTFTPNGTAAAVDTTIQFDNTPGNYLFEVTVSDSRGFTEVTDTVPVILYDTGGTLPPNDPPTAHPQLINAVTGTSAAITLTGTDPESLPLIFTVTSQPANGTLTGTVPDLSYASDGGFTGTDSFTFEVMDTEGQVSSATITIDVTTQVAEADVYEPFDYPVGVLTGQNGGTGFAAGWLAPEGTNYQGSVWDETTNAVFDGSTLDWDGVLNNGFPTAPAVGARYAGATASVTSNQTIARQLASDAGTLAGADGVLWMSAVYHFPNRGYGAGINIGLSNGYVRDRGRNFGSSTTDFIGATGWLPDIATWNYKLNTVIVNDTWSSTADDAWAANPNALPAGSLDLIVVLKFTFGPGSDTVEGYVFSEDETSSLNESTFDSGKITATGSIDESTLTQLAVTQGRFNNAIDEIRIGNSFASVMGVQGDPPDTDAPTLAAADIVDDRSGEAVTQNDPVTYTITFSEEMDAATVDETDFSNAGTAAMTVDSIIHPVSGVFVVQVTPTTAGTLQLQVDAGAVLTDLAGNPLDTTLAIVDGTEITVNPQLVQVPDVTGMVQADAEAEINNAGLAVGTISTQYHASVPAGSVISQNPSGGISVSLDTSVSLVVSLGPSNGYDYAIADLPVSGELLGSASDLQASDGVYESLRELRTGGKPNSRVSYLEHKWLFEVGTNDILTFFVEAHHTSNSEGDNFTFAYSTSGADGSYSDMLTVSKTADDDTLQSFVLPPGTTGTIHVRVIDTDRTAGNGSQETLYIDQMYFLSEMAPVVDYDTWTAQFAGAELSDPAADLDGDGVNNGAERLWGLDPTQAKSLSPMVDAMGDSGVFQYTRRDPALTGATYTVWTSSDLTVWTEDTGASQVSGGADANGVEVITVTLSPGVLGGDKLFVRIQAVE